MRLATSAHAEGKWDVTFESANLDTVWVDAKIVSDKANYLPCALNMNCHHYSWTLTIFPPAYGVWAGGWWHTEIRDGGTRVHVPIADLGVVHVALSPNQIYVFDGRFTHLTGNHSCEIPECGYTEDLTANEYNAGLLPTRPITWGMVKSMYRSP